VPRVIRLLLSLLVQLLSNALGLLVAAYVLDDVTVSGSAFVIAVVIFTAVYAIAQPLLTQMALSKAPALRGGVALVATLVGLVVTSLVTDGLSIDGGLAWLEATVIVWLVAMLGVLLLPLILIRKKVDEKGR
jgi:putative membrane protein